jgi:hypothetical protein
VYSRIADLGNAPAFRGKFPAGMTAELRKLYYDTAGTSAQTTIAGLLNVVPPTQLMLGSDYPLAGPPPTNVMIEHAVEDFEAYKPSPQLKALVEHDNAVRLVPRLAQIQRVS